MEGQRTAFKAYHKYCLTAFTVMLLFSITGCSKSSSDLLAIGESCTDFDLSDGTLYELSAEYLDLTDFYEYMKQNEFSKKERADEKWLNTAEFGIRAESYEQEKSLLTSEKRDWIVYHNSLGEAKKQTTLEDKEQQAETYFSLFEGGTDIQLEVESIHKIMRDSGQLYTYINYQQVIDNVPVSVYQTVTEGLETEIGMTGRAEFIYSDDALLDIQAYGILNILQKKERDAKEVIPINRDRVASILNDYLSKTDSSKQCTLASAKLVYGKYDMDGTKLLIEPIMEAVVSNGDGNKTVYQIDLDTGTVYEQAYEHYGD